MLIVDAHSHLYPRSYIELLKGRAKIPRVVERDGGEEFLVFPEEEALGGRLLGPGFWDLEAKLAFMDRAGIDHALVSLGNPWLDAFDGPESLELARSLNAGFASLERETNGRVLGLGVLPTNGVASATQAAREITATSGLYGIVSGCRICGLRLDDGRLDPLWSVLADSGVPLFVHPHYGAAIDDLAGYGHALPIALGFPFETTIAIVRLVLGGVLRRFPGLRIVAAHGGGTLPFLAARLDVAWRSEPESHERLPTPPSEELTCLYVDAVVFHPRALRAAADLVGTERMVFGTDHPFFGADPETSLDAVKRTWDDDARAQVLGGTAATLFHLPAVEVGPSGQ